MGVIVSRLTKPIKTFNIENRAQKVLHKQKPVPSPHYPSTIEQLRISKEVNPNFMENHYKKDKELDERLKQIFVASHMQHGDMYNEKSDKSMPHRRTADKDFDYGFWEPSQVPAGRCHLRTALAFMSKHTTNPEVHTVDNIASEHKLDRKDVENILAYYRVYQIVQNDSKVLLSEIRHDVKEKIENK